MQNGENASGFYYIIGERSSFSRFDQLTISYDLLLRATAMDGAGSALLFSDTSDPSFLGGSGPYPNSNVVGTFISVAFLHCNCCSGWRIHTDTRCCKPKNKRPSTCVLGRRES